MSALLQKTDDFSDRISPMLVKELRQGLRARTFVAIFLCLQAFLALMIISIGAASGPGTAISAIIFTTFGIAVIVIQPLRGLNAISGEVRDNTIDMMVLTKLSSWRIALGKWVAIVGQSALLLATIIPYLILRYFFGGMDLLGEMIILALIFITSMMLTAVTVGLSGSPSKVLRGIILLSGLGLLMMSFTFSIQFVFMSGSMGGFTLDSDAWTAIALYVAFAIYYGWSALSLGTSLIAPAAENHSTWRRIIALVLTLGICLYTFVDDIDEELTMFLLLAVISPALIIALTEQARMVPAVWAPFFKRGLIGRLVGMILAPGWASGVVFSICIFFIATLTVIFDSSKISDDSITYTACSIACLLIPGLLVSFTKKPESDRLSLFLLISIALGILGLSFGGIVSSFSTGSAYAWFFSWNPYVLMMMKDSYRFDDSAIGTTSLVLCVTLLGIMLLRAFYVLTQQRNSILAAQATASRHPESAPAEIPAAP